MKTKFKIVGKHDTKISIEVTVESASNVLTRYEVVALRERIKNDMHAVLRGEGFNVSQISVKK